MPRPLPEIEPLLKLEAAAIDPPSPIIECLIERGSKLMLVGSSKANKSWCLMDMGFCVSQPVKLWWGMPTHQGSVLYINFELHRYFFRERMRQISRAHGFEAICNRNFDVWNLRGCAQDYQLLATKIRARLGGRKHYVLIIIDPFYKFSSSTKVENAAQDMAAVLNVIEEMSVDLETAVAFAHHSPKGDVSDRDVVDKGSGSGVFGRDPDAIIAVHRVGRAGNSFKAEFALRYHPPKDPVGLKFTFPLMQLSDEETVSIIGRPEKRAAATLLSLLNGEPISGTDWERLADQKLDMPASTYRRKRAELVAKGFITKTPEGLFFQKPEENE